MPGFDRKVICKSFLQSLRVWLRRRYLQEINLIDNTQDCTGITYRLSSYIINAEMLKLPPIGVVDVVNTAFRYTLVY
ncbi:hypothetical protein C6P77_25685 [Burkholderia ambifaria]|nr:hypothetical protein C6P77_25685 [Burkholderia ambifaria]